MNEQEQFWSGAFGDQYTARNQVDWRARIPFWQEVIDFTGARSVHEIGANAGWNLSAIRRACPDVVLTGNDINKSAMMRAAAAGLDVWKGNPARAELVFTAGVLIHVAPVELQAVMQSAIDASFRYVLAVEYDDFEETEVVYRGHAGKLWRRPYGRWYERMGLTLVKQWNAGSAFDRCTAYLLEKSA